MSDDLRARIRAAISSQATPRGLGGPERVETACVPLDAAADAVMAAVRPDAPDDLDQFVREQAELDPAFAAEYVKAQHAASVRALQDLLGSIKLYISWPYVTKQLTTEQKELFADSVEASSARLDAADPGAPAPRRLPRWWREDYQPEVDR